MFLDEVEVSVESGKGGAGCISFLREKFRPKGGPDGGDGGWGGNVILVATTSTNTLIDYRTKRQYKAQNGVPGQPKHCTGAKGKDLELPVPVGTIVSDLETGHALGDLTAPDQRLLIARGGQGGRGNARFQTSTIRAPRIADTGKPGQHLDIRMELKLIADVGLVGMPNAGKSTLVSMISNSRPKIASYPFTTLVPNLGVVERGVGQPFVVADVPGLIQGAADGHGLGHQFLKHIERTRILIHLIDLTAENQLETWQAIRNELGLFNPELLERPELIALNKTDALTEEQLAEAKETFKGKRFQLISAATGQGTKELVARISSKLTMMDEKEAD